MKRPSRKLTALCLSIAVVFATGCWFFFSSSARQEVGPAHAPFDPRLAYAGPYKNIHPDISFVGSEKCATCHPDIADSYAQHPMGRSLLPVENSQVLPIEAVNNMPFHAFGDLFFVERRNGKWLHGQKKVTAKNETVFQSLQEVHFLIGSGNHGHSFVTNRSGFLFQTSISWFNTKKAWDLSPGWFKESPGSRPVLAQCLFCHSNHAQPLKNTINGFREPIFHGHAIGCERCHGPGQKHVENPGHFDPELMADLTIVNPAKLSYERREAICQQCHLEGVARVLPRGRDLFDFRPGLALESFLSIFVNAQDTGEDKKAVNHVEQLVLSSCFKKSIGNQKLGCISCHDPHRRVPADERVAFFRKACLKCHESRQDKNPQKPACSIPLAQRSKREDSCIACHMPAYAASDIAHSASTDHRIVRIPDKETQAKRTAKSTIPIVSFHRGRPTENQSDLSRDLGIALVEVALRGKIPFGFIAIDLLESALQEDPDDVVAWKMKGIALARLGRHSEALACCEAILSKSPTDEQALSVAAALHQELNHAEQALDCWNRAVAVNPWISSYRQNLVQLLSFLGRWQEALPHSRQWVLLEPLHLEARKSLVECLVRTSNMREARQEFSRIAKTVPPAALPHWNQWFEGLLPARSK